MSPAMTCPDCGARIDHATDLAVGRRVHRVSVASDGSVSVDSGRTITLWHCAACGLVVGYS